MDAQQVLNAASVRTPWVLIVVELEYVEEVGFEGLRQSQPAPQCVEREGNVHRPVAEADDAVLAASHHFGE